VKLLLSGLIGALIASVLSILYQYLTEIIRRRRDIMIEVVSWSDDIYDRLQAVQTQKDTVYPVGAKRYLTDDEYREISRELKTMLLSSKTHAKINLIYGEGEELKMFNALREELLRIARIIWTANEKNWTESSKKIIQDFGDKIDPLRQSIERGFILRTRVRSVARDCLLSFFYKIKYKSHKTIGEGHMKQKIKKVIAKEGLIVIGLLLLASILFYVFQHNLFPIKKYLSYNQAVYWGLEKQGGLFDDLLYEAEVGFSYGETLISKLFILFYSAYLFIRFTLWAIRTLMAKKNVT
jgi:hypothetical protein